MHLLHNSMNCKEGTDEDCGIQDRTYGEHEASQNPRKKTDGLGSKQCLGITKLIPGLLRWLKW